MNRLLLFLLLVLPGLLHAQETKKLKIKNERTGEKEIYYVLKSDRQTKHGAYEKKNYRGKLKVRGFYKQGEMDSTWTYYSQWSGKIQASGSYKANQKVGEWNYFNYEGKLEQTYNHSEGKLIFSLQYPRDTTKEITVFENEDTVKKKIDQFPVYIGGEFSMMEWIAQELEYPAMARENNIQGRVVISFEIDENGKTSNYKIESGIGYGCDEAALKVVQSLPNGWTSASDKGENVRVKMIIPIRFVLG